MSLDRLLVGSVVLLLTPDNPRLNKTKARIFRLTEWGAHVFSEAAASGKFRALFQEMAILEECNGKHSVYEKVKGKENGYTGNVCNICGAAKMIRSGMCEVCQDCGSTSGCS